MKTRHIIQGECQISDSAEEVFSTILGSCVSTCLYDSRLKVGGMNHFLLPEIGAGSRDLRYAGAAIEQLINKLLRNGARKADLCAKIFGGATIVAGLSDIGKRNALSARSFLIAENIHIAESDIGGSSARRVHFWPTSGRSEVLIVHQPEVALRERPASTPRHSVDLF